MLVETNAHSNEHILAHELSFKISILSPLNSSCILLTPSYLCPRNLLILNLYLLSIDSIVIFTIVVVVLLTYVSPFPCAKALRTKTFSGCSLAFKRPPTWIHVQSLLPPCYPPHCHWRSRLQRALLLRYPSFPSSLGLEKDQNQQVRWLSSMREICRVRSGAICNLQMQKKKKGELRFR